jgi:hypothetical protein
MKTSSLMLAAVCIAMLPVTHASADDQKKRFLEFPTKRDVTTYDLTTVQLIQPGRFTIISTVVDNPDFMRLRLKVLETLRAYCTRDDGMYPAPTDVLISGPPDLPIENIEVKTFDAKTKRTSWSDPYSKFALDKAHYHFFFCETSYSTQDQEYSKAQTAIMDGTRIKQIFDCKRGLKGMFDNLSDDPTKAIIMGTPRKGSLAEEIYVSVCSAVTNEAAYLP